MKTGRCSFLWVALSLSTTAVLARSTIHDTSEFDASFDSGHEFAKRHVDVHDLQSEPEPETDRIVRSLPPQALSFRSTRPQINNVGRQQAIHDTDEGERISYGGPGCPQSSLNLSALGPISTAPSLSDLHKPTTLHLSYPSLNVSTSESVSFARSQCSLTVDLASLGPETERHYSLKGLNTRVRYRLNGGGSAVVTLAVYIPGEPEQRTFTKTLPPPPPSSSSSSPQEDGDGETEVVLWKDEELTPCPRGGGLVIRASVTISGSSNPSSAGNSVSVVAFEPLFDWKDGSCEKDNAERGAFKDLL